MSIWSASVPRVPSKALSHATMAQIDTAMATLDMIPMPNQMTKIDAMAIFGVAFNTSATGSSTRDRNGDHQRARPTAVPRRVPKANPTSCS
jgi:hypothetical protein